MVVPVTKWTCDIITDENFILSASNVCKIMLRMYSLSYSRTGFKKFLFQLKWPFVCEWDFTYPFSATTYCLSQNSVISYCKHSNKREIFRFKELCLFSVQKIRMLAIHRKILKSFRPVFCSAWHIAHLSFKRLRVSFKGTGTWFENRCCKV